MVCPSSGLPVLVREASKHIRTGAADLQEGFRAAELPVGSPVPDRWGPRQFPHLWSIERGGALTSLPVSISISRAGERGTYPGTFHRQPRAATAHGGSEAATNEFEQQPGLGVGKPRDSRQQRSWSWRTIAHALAAPRAVFLTDAGCVRLDHPAAPLCECVVATAAKM
eukprot:766484-Hanusia_phi.AAC.6